MKQFNLFAVALLGTLILGACSTSNEVVGGGIFHKRKYTGGVYVDRSEKQKEAKTESKEENYDISLMNQESQKKYVSSQEIRTEEKQTVAAAACVKPSSDVEKVERKQIKELTSNEEVEFDITRVSESRAKKYTASQTIRQSNKNADVEELYADDQTMASLDNSAIPATSTNAKREEETKISETKKKKHVKMSNKSFAAVDTILLIILAILLPPLAVGIYEGITVRFWISLILTLLFWLPGVIYAILVVTGTI